jgi:ribosomal protein S6--L-glutamate ligase
MKHMKNKQSSKLIVGWQEWCRLPKLHLPAIKAKIDTGAKTSALHAWDVRPVRKKGVLYVHFTVHPIQRDNYLTVNCTAKVVDQRTVMSSGGHKEKRYVIQTQVVVGENSWDIEITLTNRDAMAFRMLLGRDALKGHAIVDPQTSLHQGKFKKQELRRLYRQESKS